MTLHDLKLREEFFDAVRNKVKTFEIRKDDRGFKVGDTIIFTLVRDIDGNPTMIPETHFKAVITYIATHSDFAVGIPEGYVVMAIKVVGE